MLDSFERKNQPLLPRAAFLVRVAKSVLTALLLIALSLGLGAVGYHTFAGLGWIDAIHAASMILTGMGPVQPMNTDGAKLFETCYALFSGVAFLTIAALLLGPLAHRLMHRFHLELDNDIDSK